MVRAAFGTLAVFGSGYCGGHRCRLNELRESSKADATRVVVLCSAVETTPASCAVKQKVLIALVACTLALPIAAILTFLLGPLWEWCEARWGIESIGHSGPAEWCFVAVYVVCAILFVACMLIPSKRHRREVR